MVFKDRFIEFVRFCSHSVEKNSWIILLLFIAAHALIKFSSLGIMDVQGDEAFSLYYSQQDLSEMLHRFYDGEPNPPLYYVLLNIWVHIFGIDPVSVKSLGIILSLFTATGLWFLAKKIGRTSGAIFVSLCFLFSNLHFDFTHEIRAFQLELFLTTISYILYFSVVKNKRGYHILLLGIINAFLVYTHYNAALIPISQLLATFIFYLRDRGELIAFVKSGIISFLLFIPQFLSFGNSMPDENFWLGTSGIADFEYVLFKVVGLDHWNTHLLILYAVSPLLVILLDKLSLMSEKFSYKTFFTLWILFSVPLLINFGLAQKVPSFRLRYLLFTSFGVYLSLGYLISHFRFQLISFVIVVISGVLFFTEFNLNPRPSEGWKTTSEIVHQLQKGKKTRILICSSFKYRDFIYYFDRKAFADYNNIPGNLSRLRIYPLRTIEDAHSAMNGLDEGEQIIYIQSHVFLEDPESLIFNELNTKYNSCVQLKNQYGAQINLFSQNNCGTYEITSDAKTKQDSCYTIVSSSFLNNAISVEKNKQQLTFSECREAIVYSESQYSISIDDSHNGVFGIEGEIDYNAENTSELYVSFVIEKEKTILSYELIPIPMDQTKLQFSASANSDPFSNGVAKVYIWNPGGGSIKINQLEVDFLRFKKD